MKKTTLSVALAAVALAFNTATAQVAAQKGVTIEEISKQINDLAAKNNEAAKLELAKEAKALVSSKDEKFIALGSRVYEFIGNSEAAEQANKSIVKKFPKGTKARSEAYNKIFEDKTATFSTVEKKYNEWLKKFPASNFEEKEREIYNQAIAKLIPLAYQDGANQKANEYLKQIDSSPNYSNYALEISKSLILDKKYQDALAILEKGYNKVNNDQSRQGKYSTSQIAPTYASVLNEVKQSDEAIIILTNLEKSTTLSPESVSILAEAYIQQGNSLDAFITVSNAIVKTGKNKALETKLESLYKQLNNNKGDYQAYVNDLNRQLAEATTAKYKSQMIKKEAPNFSLVNMKGETVSLTDLKGKVIVLDFWATWCGPCKISFPGMQAAVNKYKDDKEVEFLFIDTWQREENYKEVVEKFIADNKYTFNVLFDEMKDRAKATTTAYDVKGIPHKVVIDKDGFIRFESSGGSADVEKIVDEMSTKIELARKG